ncbi:DNA-binding response regulator, NarL/FixJ family, contains REC and HTH domains [Nonomuraea solani]|uniref:DNA-binding response regulator, NarL/FixJ family, contains REC and HTH domains n=2 Tax=Nonomuraea solani TaxID=1144553 RepID=A0A1H6EXL6_9ACTN|nr:response regulator transcription factor [Nonomuraea solani]SEH02153.1 DNA-binding response regulator, NarL/FixJ family, contains REC and HTH domains [Nonomuraea solani]
MVSVLVVDDQVLIRAGLAALIRAAPGLDVVGEAATGQEAVELAAALRPDVVLMDIRMPGMNGLAATERILAAGGERAPKILILTVFDIDEYVYTALRLGAGGFLLKDTPPERLIAAIHTVAAGDVLLVPNAVKRLVEAFADAPKVAPPEVPDLALLTKRETEVLQAVGRAMSNREIADRLLVSEATVKTHLNRLMAKLNLSSRAQAVVLAYECGLVKPRRAGA